MENKPENEIQILDNYRKHSGLITLPLKFVPFDGYYPLLAIPAYYRGTYNPYFTNIQNSRIDFRLSKLNIACAGKSFRYSKGTGQHMNISSGLYSTLASQVDFEFMPSALINTKYYRMKGDVDIFCLGIVKLAHLPEFNIHGGVSRYRRKSATIDLKMNEVIILVNEEKLRKTLYAKTYYTPTVRKKILDQITIADHTTSVTVKDVSNEYLESFLISPHTVRTNSLVETLKIDTEIKDSVFSNLKDVLV